MANERTSQDRAKQLKQKHGAVGKGMSSPDSTQKPLKAKSGTPDKRTEKGRKH